MNRKFYPSVTHRNTNLTTIHGQNCLHKSSNPGDVTAYWRSTESRKHALKSIIEIQDGRGVSETCTNLLPDQSGITTKL